MCSSAKLLARGLANTRSPSPEGGAALGFAVFGSGAETGASAASFLGGGGGLDSVGPLASPPPEPDADGL